MILALTFFVFFSYPKSWQKNRIVKIVLLIQHSLGSLALGIVFICYKDVPYEWMKWIVSRWATIYQVTVIMLSAFFFIRLIISKCYHLTLYYWFGDKTSIVCEATQYGLKTVTDEIFKYVFASLNDLKGFFANCLDYVSKYKKELRFIYQLVASPVYGDKIRKTGKDFNFIYDKYTHRLSQLLDCNEQLLRSLVYLFISAVLDYVIWDEKEKSQM